MITTIQVSKRLKDTLNCMKESRNQSYEQVIFQIIKTLEDQKRKEVDLMIEGAKETAKESLKISKNWEGTLMDGLDKDEKW